MNIQNNFLFENINLCKTNNALSLTLTNKQIGLLTTIIVLAMGIFLACYYYKMSNKTLRVNSQAPEQGIQGKFNEEKNLQKLSTTPQAILENGFKECLEKLNANLMKRSGEESQKKIILAGEEITNQSILSLQKSCLRTFSLMKKSLAPIKKINHLMH